jgi:hypothetical protein
MTAKADVGMQIKMNTKSFKEIIDLHHGRNIDESGLLELVDFVNERHDCADFRMIVLIKVYHQYRDLLTEKTISAIRSAILNFKYAMSEPGSDGMCYWSENHQLLFATCEFLAGRLFPDTIFQNDQRTGLLHANDAKEKILRWLYHRFIYGFTEWHSNTYYEEDIAPLCVLVDHSGDAEIIEKSKMILDLLFLDMAMHSYEGYFVATSGRCYEDQKRDPRKADVNDILAHAFGIQKRDYDYTRLSSLYLICTNYQVPEVIKRIAKDSKTSIIKDSMGLDLKEVKREMPKHDMLERGLFLWSMEAFTNYESINMTLDMFNAWNLKENNFLRDLKQVNIPIIRKLGLLPLVVKLLNPATQGVAIERANTYTYKTKDYMLSTAQHYHPKFFGDQQHIWQATLPKQVSIFSTHPGSPMFDDAARNFSPSYWVGNGINPDAIQHENKLFVIYDLTRRKGYLERKRQDFIHIHFPIDQMDHHLIDLHYAAGQSESGYIAIKTHHLIETVSSHELILRGKHVSFVVIMGSATQDGTFENFVDKVKQSSLETDRHRMRFSCQDIYVMRFKRGLWVNGKLVNTAHQRYETPYVKSLRQPETFEIAHQGYSLFLDFKHIKRLEQTHV